MKRCKEIERENDYFNYTYVFQPGAIYYQVEKADKYLVLTHNTNGQYEHTYYDYLTFENIKENKLYVPSADIKDE